MRLSDPRIFSNKVAVWVLKIAFRGPKSTEKWPKIKKKFKKITTIFAESKNVRIFAPQMRWFRSLIE